MPDGKPAADIKNRTHSLVLCGELSVCEKCRGPQRTPAVHARHCKADSSLQDCHSSGIDSRSNDSSLTYPERGNTCKVRGNEFSSEQSLDGHLNVDNSKGVPKSLARFGRISDATPALSPITEDALVGGSTTGDNTARSSGQANSFLLQSRDLPSRRLLGKGLSAIGYETTWNGERCARKDFIGVPRDIFEKEAGVLVGLKDHKNVVKTHGWTVDKRSCSLVLEYMDDDLLSLLQQKTAINEDQGGHGSPSTSSTFKPLDNLSEALDTMLQIARGMEFLHEQGVAHGDLKTKNILVTHGDQNSKVVKVTDFGLVGTKRKSQSKVSPKVRKLNFVQWKAPEYLEILLRQLNYLSNDEDGTSSESDSDSESNKTSSPSAANVRLSGVDAFASDVYSFGVICSQILTGKDPYPTLDWIDLGNKILSGLRPHLPDACPSFLRDILISCWSDSAQRRPTFSKIRNCLEKCDAIFPTTDLVIERLRTNLEDSRRHFAARQGAGSGQGDQIREREAWAKGKEGLGERSSEERSKNSIGDRPTSVWRPWSRQVSQDEVTSGRDLHRPGIIRFNGVRFLSNRGKWVAEMRPPRFLDKICFGEFESQVKAARAVDAAFHHYGKPNLVNFADTPRILSEQPKSAGLDRKEKVELVKMQAKLLASMASALPSKFTSTAILAPSTGTRAFGGVASAAGAQALGNIAGTGTSGGINIDSEKISAQKILKKSLIDLRLKKQSELYQISPMSSQLQNYHNCSNRVYGNDKAENNEYKEPGENDKLAIFRDSRAMLERPWKIIGGRSRSREVSEDEVISSTWIESFSDSYPESGPLDSNTGPGQVFQAMEGFSVPRPPPFSTRQVQNQQQTDAAASEGSPGASGTSTSAAAAFAAEASFLKSLLRRTPELHEKFVNHPVAQLGGFEHPRSDRRPWKDSLLGSLDINSSLQLTQALQMQSEVQKRLVEQLELQRELQLRLEEQSQSLKMMLETQAEAFLHPKPPSIKFRPAPSLSEPAHSRNIPAQSFQLSEPSSHGAAESSPPQEPSTEKARVEVPNLLVIVPQKPSQEAYNKQDPPKTGLLIHGCSGRVPDSSASCISHTNLPSWFSRSTSSSQVEVSQSGSTYTTDFKSGVAPPY